MLYQQLLLTDERANMPGESSKDQGASQYSTEKNQTVITVDIYLEPREEGSRFTRMTVLIGIMITSDDMRPKDDTQQASCHAAKRK